MLQSVKRKRDPSRSPSPSVAAISNGEGPNIEHSKTSNEDEQEQIQSVSQTNTPEQSSPPPVKKVALNFKKPPPSTNLNSASRVAKPNPLGSALDPDTLNDAHDTKNPSAPTDIWAKVGALNRKSKAKFRAEDDDDDSAEEYLGFTVAPSSPEYETSLLRRRRQEIENSLHRLPGHGSTKPNKAALATNILAADPDSKGAAMMARMGYKPGQALGASREGRLEPVEMSLKFDKGGLGMAALKAQRTQEHEENTKRKAHRRAVARGEEQDTADEYLEALWGEGPANPYPRLRTRGNLDDLWVPGAVRVRGPVDNETRAKQEVEDMRAFQSRKAQKARENRQSLLLRKAQGTLLRYLYMVEEEDGDRVANPTATEKKSLKNLPLKSVDVVVRDRVKAMRRREVRAVYPQPGEMGVDEDEKDDIIVLMKHDENLDEDDDELDAFEALPVSERLDKVVAKLREHLYCFWCWCEYPDARMEGCPGLEEEAH